VPVLLFARVAGWLNGLDQWLAPWVVSLLGPLGLYVLISALDDLAMDVLWFRRLVFRRKTAGPKPVSGEPGIAVMIPLWGESQVIGPMLDHNVGAIDYSNYEVFVGVYRNDEATRNAVSAAAVRHGRVHLAEVPHDGPTCKADCLNWIYQRILLYEEERGRQFAILVLHDAEDLIHPKSFRLIAQYSAQAGMVQIPVLPLRTGLLDFTNGLYCDDFAESQGKDLASRVDAGGFLPGCGVGTAFRREALELLAERDANQIFHPGSLTEDYDTGCRLHQSGCRQVIVPLVLRDGVPVATREYFPRTQRTAVRQRSRWITGNALQAWERFGWGGGMNRRWIQAWFFWRDRKGLWGNPLSLACNILLAYGCLSWLLSALTGGEWALRAQIRNSAALVALTSVNAFLLVERMALRIAFSASVYGVPFGLLAPLRVLWGNWINTRATLSALWTYLGAKLRNRPLRWLKTEHAYPTRTALMGHKRRLGEILVSNGYCTQASLDAALASRPRASMLGEHMMSLGLISEDELYEALSLQQSLPVAEVDVKCVHRRVARALPIEASRDWQVLPFRVAAGRLDVASHLVPTDQVQVMVQKFTRLEVRFHLVPKSRFEELRKQMLE
jgi:adsorption protein B